MEYCGDMGEPDARFSNALISLGVTPASIAYLFYFFFFFFFV